MTIMGLQMESGNRNVSAKMAKLCFDLIFKTLFTLDVKYRCWSTWQGKLTNNKYKQHISRSPFKAKWHHRTFLDVGEIITFCNNTQHTWLRGEK